MENRTHLGMNRTGVQMSPLLTADMIDAQDARVATATRVRGDLQVRLDYADATDGLGSVPVPGTLKGMFASGADMLTGKRPQVLIDKLGERLAFERGGTRLYETLLVKCRSALEPLPTDDIDMLMRFRDQEAEHFALVVRAIERLGADPTAQTPCADLVGVESMGLVQAMNDPRTSLAQSLHVMLDAELIDNAGWELLIDLTRETGHDTIADEFAVAARQEAEHLVHIKALVSRLTLKDASLLDTLKATMAPDSTGDGAAAGGAAMAGTPLQASATGAGAALAAGPADGLAAEAPLGTRAEIAEGVASAGMGVEPAPLPAATPVDAVPTSASVGMAAVPPGLAAGAAGDDARDDSPALARLPDAEPEPLDPGLQVTREADTEALAEPVPHQTAGLPPSR